VFLLLLKNLSLGLSFFTYLLIKLTVPLNISDTFICDNIKIFEKFRAVSAVTDFTHLQSDIDSTSRWCDANVRNLTQAKLMALPLQGKFSQLTINTNYVTNIQIVPNPSKDLGVLSASKLFLYHHVDYIFSQSL